MENIQKQVERGSDIDFDKKKKRPSGMFGTTRGKRGEK